MAKWRGLVAALCVLGCSGSERSSGTRDDTATSAPKPLAMEHFTLPAQAVTRIHMLLDAEGKVFAPLSFRNFFAFTRAGNIAVVDVTNRHLLLFDANGREMHRVALVGVDANHPPFPGAIFVLPGDSIAVWDNASRRMFLFDASLHLDRTERFAPWEDLSGQSSPVGRLADGRWVWWVLPRHHYLFRRPPDVETVVEKSSLMAGRSDEAPVEFHRLPSRRGVRVVMRTGMGQTSSQTLWPTTDVRMGAVCERGVVLLDPESVRILDANGHAVSVSPLPRAGETIRASERAEIVESMMFGPLATSSIAGEARSALEKLVRASTVRGRRPVIDSYGQLWYLRRDEKYRSTVLERVDSAGQPNVTLSLPNLGWEVHVGANTLAMNQHTSDTGGLAITLVHFPIAWTKVEDSRLGRCAASFAY